MRDSDRVFRSKTSVIPSSASIVEFLAAEGALNNDNDDDDDPSKKLGSLIVYNFLPPSNEWFSLRLNFFSCNNGTLLSILLIRLRKGRDGDNNGWAIVRRHKQDPKGTDLNPYSLNNIRNS